jgi:X-X-X-Leu-X-X-Gly heptad repeat protein
MKRVHKKPLTVKQNSAEGSGASSVASSGARLKMSAPRGIGGLMICVTLVLAMTAGLSAFSGVASAADLEARAVVAEFNSAAEDFSETQASVNTNTSASVGVGTDAKISDSNQTKNPTQLALSPVDADFSSDQQAEVTNKEEIIYALLDSSGKLDSAYAVNHFELSSDGYLTDYGDYQQVNNLSNLYPISLEAKSVRIASDRGDYYYQGNIQNLMLPWQISISYSLDGQPVAASDASTLAGKSGRLQINIDTSQAPDTGVDPSFYENYTLQVAVTIDAAKSSNVDAPDATVAAAGGDRQITYAVLPDSNGQLTFAADVTDFEMPGIQIAAVPFSMNFDMPDTSSISTEMNQLVNAIRELNNGVYELDRGAAQIASAANQAAVGAQQFNNGLSAANAGLANLAAGSQQFSDGLNQLTGESGNFSGQLAQLSAAANGLKPLMDSGAFSTYPPEVQQALGALINGVPAAADGYNQLNGGLQGLSNSYTNPDPAAGINAGIQASTGGINSLSQNYGAISNGLNQLSSGAAQLNAGTQRLAAGTSELYGGVQDMPQTMQNKIDEFVASYDFSGFEPHSYLSADNPKVSLVQFVIKTPDISLPSTSDDHAVVVKEESLWDRFTALFT